MSRPTSRTLTKLAILFGEHGITDRGHRLLLCSDHAGRGLTSSAELTQAEANALIKRLEKLARDCLPAAVARLLATPRHAAVTPGGGADG